MTRGDDRTGPSVDELPCVETLYDTYGTLVFSLALRILRDVGEAQDVVQDVFIQAWTQRGRYDRRRGAVAGWLLVMTRSRAIDRVRARRGTQLESGRAPCRVDALAAPKTADLDDARGVRAAIARLTLDQRRALELAYFDGYTHVEIAGLLQQPLGTIKTRIRRAMLHLRAHLVAYEPPLLTPRRIRTPRVDQVVRRVVRWPPSEDDPSRYGIRLCLASRPRMTVSTHLYRHRRSLSLSGETRRGIHGV